MIEIESSVRSSFTEQAAVCETLGSPFTANLIRATESALDRSTATGRAILEWQGSPGALGDALALRVAGALHALAMSGQSSTLSSIYPPHSNVAPDQMRAGVARALREHDAVLLSWLQFAPQTNEVARSAALYLGLMEVCRRTQLPLRLLEIGSSGGLNLMLDHYEYIFDGQHFGSASSALTLVPRWEGPSPAACNPEILSRRGCDLAPLDLTEPDHRQRLQAYIWADQLERRQRLVTAMAILQRSPPVIDRADAVDWIRQQVQPPPADGNLEAATVLIHSIVLSYLPSASQAALTEHMETIGRLATPAAPLGWVAFELHPDKAARLTLRLWPGGELTVLAEADPHCSFIRYRGGS